MGVSAIRDVIIMGIVCVLVEIGMYLVHVM